MEREVAISILEDVKESLFCGKESGIKTLDIYQKNLELATSPKINKMINLQNEYIKKYGENRKQNNKNEQEDR